MDGIFDKKRKFGILYFSGTGNTFFVVRKIQTALKGRGHECNILAADQLQVDCGLSYDNEADVALLKEKLYAFLKGTSNLILAFPVYASDIPAPIKQLIKLFPKGKTRDLAVIGTIHKAGGDASLIPGKYLERKGYQQVLAAYVKMPNNLQLPGFEFFRISNGDELKAFYESTQKTVDEIVDKLLEQKSYTDGDGLVNSLIGAAQRMGENFMSGIFTKSMYADDKCTKCGLCVSICPTANITFKDGVPVFGNKCCLCTRCYNFCPANAIQISGKTSDDIRFKRYKGFDGWKPPRLREVDMNVEVELKNEITEKSSPVVERSE